MSNFKQEVNELKELLGAKTDAQLAEKMGVAVPTISTWKQRGLSGDAKLALFTARKEKITQNESDKPLHVNTSYISPKMDDMIRMFAILDRADQKRIFEEIKKLSDEKLDLSHLNEE